MTKFLKFFLFLPIVVCAQTKKNDWKTLAKANYSIQYPSAWELNESGQGGSSFILFSALEPGQDKFRENVNLLIQDLTGQNIDINKYTEISESQIKTKATNGKLIESKRIKTGKEYHKIIYTADQGTLHLKFEMYYWVIANKAYLLTFTSEQTKFESFKATGEKILNSFKLK
ncbi:MAG: hypothetical protein IAF38_02155 [Bacteroidia bacterium]|nr:hypothetical protein [Bacteroidia bacterium]